MLDSYMHTISNQSLKFTFDNSYVKLPDHFYCKLNPTPVKEPKLIKINDHLAVQLGMDPKWLGSKKGIEVLSGNVIFSGSEPIAMAYAGHQFGYWVPQLGDGRAIMLGEVLDKNNNRYDVQLKGSGFDSFFSPG